VECAETLALDLDAPEETLNIEEGAFREGETLG
jgi:hypothetical protein